MEHTVKAYLKKQSTQNLISFVKKYANNELTEDYTSIIPEILNELLERWEILTNSETPNP